MKFGLDLNNIIINKEDLVSTNIFISFSIAGKYAYAVCYMSEIGSDDILK